MIDASTIPYRLMRSARRTLSLTLDPAGQLTAHAPARMPIADVEAFITAKAPWIRKKQSLLSQRGAIIKGCSLEDGSFLPYLGGSLRIAYHDRSRPAMDNGVLYLPLQGDPRIHALNWFKTNAAEILPPLTADWARRMNVFPTSLAFGHAAARWGSMSTSGAMRLNLALLHCPLEIIVYVIVHELAHRLHPNHSKAFHACVSGFLPAAPQLRAQLKALAPYLSLLRPPNTKEAP